MMVEKSKNPIKKPIAKFELNEKVILELIDLASEPGSDGKVKKGINVTTKAIEKGLAQLVIVADDIEPKTVAAHLPILCKEKEIPLIRVSSKKALGGAARIDVGCGSVAIVNPGLGKELFMKIKKAI